MTLSDKNILIISPENWGTCWVSKHHYAATLAARGNQVWFLNSSLKPLVSELERCPIDRVTVLSGERSIRGIRFLPGPIRKQVHKRLFRRLAVRAGLQRFDLVMTFDPSRFLDLDESVCDCPSVFFAADLDERLPWQLPAGSATLALGCSIGITDRMKEVTDSARVIQHGHAEYPVKPHEFNDEGPHAVYAGNLCKPDLRKELLIKLVEQNPQATFHFFGDTGKGNLSDGRVSELVSTLRGVRSCVFHGAVDASRLPGIYSAADVLLCAYWPDFDRFGNPHKMMEYLASGTPILSTLLRDYESLSDAVVFTNDLTTYTQSLTTAVKMDTSEKRKRRVEFARDNSYRKQVLRIETYLGERIEQYGRRAASNAV